ncbi:MAG TPA: 2-hydroxychromene-2-carboxylate isomerase [Roseiarcus sp.]|nr:2-hydroxychromene-2-carboxylate isomerase [Roseiarcus sp.]
MAGEMVRGEMTETIEFIFDFGSPNVYLAYRALPPILARTGARLQINPCLLGGIFKATGNQPPTAAFANVKGKLAYERLEITRFIKKHRLRDFRFNPHFPVNSLLIMRGLIVAQMTDVAAPYIEAVLAATWENGLKMDDPAVVVDTLGKAGLDGEALLKRTQEPDVKQKLLANTQEAVERGVFGAPTFFVGQEIFFGKERLAQVEEELLRKAA